MGRQVQRLSPNADAISFSPDSAWLLGSNESGALFVRSAQDGSETSAPLPLVGGNISGHFRVRVQPDQQTCCIEAVAVAATGELGRVQLYTGGDDRRTIMWNLVLPTTVATQ